MDEYVNQTDLVILKTLERLGKTTISELYYEVVIIKRISYQAVRSHIRKLEKYGHVRREGRGRDAVIEITEKGRRLLDKTLQLLVMTH